MKISVNNMIKSLKPAGHETLEGMAITSDIDHVSNKVYLIRKGIKYWISSPEEFAKLGFKGEEIKRVPESVISTIPEGDPIGVSVYDIRSKICSPFIYGKGIEIGAGANPQSLPPGTICEYFDKRDSKGLDEYFGETAGLTVYPFEQFHRRFPDLADFVIAHNVLEHCPDPIRTLIEWHSYVKEGGYLILSVPYYECCPDKGRLLTPFDHILMDYLLDRGDQCFETKEHIYSNIIGWIDEDTFKDKNKIEVAHYAEMCVNSAQNDHHWHVYTEEVLQKIILFSALSSGKNVSFECIAAPYKTIAGQKTTCEIIFIYRLEKMKGPIPGSLNADIDQALIAFEKAIKALYIVRNNLDNGYE